MKTDSKLVGLIKWLLVLMIVLRVCFWVMLGLSLWWWFHDQKNVGYWVLFEASMLGGVVQPGIAAAVKDIVKQAKERLEDRSL